jgi:hypothetical protein
MWVSLVKEEKRHNRKTPKKQCKAWKWTREKKGFARRLPCCVPTKERMINKALEEKQWLKYKKTLRPLKKKQREKVMTIASYYLKFLEDGLTWNAIESICNVNLIHHPIKMAIQSGQNTMEHNFTTTSNRHPKLIWWQMKNKHITKL